MNDVNQMLEYRVMYVDVTIKQILIALGIFIVFLLFRIVFMKYIFKIASKFASKTKSKIDDEIITVFKRPVKIFVTILGIYLALRYLNISDEFNDVIRKFYRSSLIITIAWGLYNLEGTYTIIHEKMSKKLKLGSNNIIRSFISRALRFITVVLAIGIVAQEFEYNVSGFLAGLGIGGLALALAAQDTLANIFGGIVIIMDKPFDIGDWISLSDVEGVVEDINFRSTKIRTFSKSLVTVPNSKLVDKPIINNSRRGNRKITFKLGVTYDTPIDKLKKAIYLIEKMLYDHQDVDKESIYVKFDEFNDSSLDIFIYFFTSTAVWGDYLNIKQDINFKIMKIFEDEGISMAFPSRSVYFENKLNIDSENKRIENLE